MISEVRAALEKESCALDGVTLIIVFIGWRLLPVLVAAPIPVMRAHVVAVAYAEWHRARWSVLVFMHFTWWVNHESARRNRDRFSRRPNRATPGKAEINFSGVRMAVIGADLAWFPASYCDVALGDFG